MGSITIVHFTKREVHTMDIFTYGTEGISGLTRIHTGKVRETYEIDAQRQLITRYSE